MSNEIALLQKLAVLEGNMGKQAAATNFILTHIVKILDENSGEIKFSDKLKSEILDSLSKLNHSESSSIKSAINKLMQPSVQQLFTKKPDPFLK
jgi:hypothetical protein